MKLKNLFLQRYRVLRELDIKFSPNDVHLPGPEQSYSLDFLVGVNGTGKSTVLQAVFDIFRKIERNAPIEYGFYLDYVLGTGDESRSIILTNLEESAPDEDTGITQVVLGSELVALENGEPTTVGLTLLPDMVVAFTTGSEHIWKQLEADQAVESADPSSIQGLTALDLAIRELPGWAFSPDDSDSPKPDEDTRFLLIESGQLPLVTLCGLLADMAASTQDPPDYPRLSEVLHGNKSLCVQSVSGFSLKFRMAQGLSSPGDQEVVERLGAIATRKLRMGTDYLLVFDLTSNAAATAHRILTEFSDGLQLFKALAKLGRPGEYGQSILREVNIFLQRSISSHPEVEADQDVTSGDDPPLHLLDWLSDGERSFLGRMCLLSLLGETEALVLLDEPEVHFNDFWKRKIVSLLDRTLKGQNSHVLITTHSSITLSDVLEEDIVVLNRTSSYTSSALQPSLKTFAADPSEIMIHVFQAPHAAGARSVQYIQDKLSESSNGDRAHQRETLESLLPIVGEGYWKYRIRRALLEIES
jgi:ABC-type nitrate/sulfonate/bicarbonate transport system ATPase subunit